MRSKAIQDLISVHFGKRSLPPVPNRNKATAKLGVKYTRVSGKRQFDLNDSIEIQNKSIDEFGEKFGISIVASFGQTHESAKTDHRKEFQRMIEFIKKHRGKIGYILVYKHTRFSRTGGKAIALKDELKEKYGVELIAVTEHIDTTNPNGVMFQDMQLILGRWDNEQRKQLSRAGMKNKFEKGIWVVKPPQGYDIIKINNERKIVINAEGKKIQKAWDWKLQGMKNEEIISRLVAMGVKMYKQQMVKIFTNPFYCGLIAHGMLEGKVVEGVHEAMVSKETFVKVNGSIENSPLYGVPHKCENENLPLKVFVKCSVCSQPLTGYLVKAKGLYYYKCRTKGCAFNMSANRMHGLFSQFLSGLVVKNELVEPMLYELEHRLEGEKTSREELEKTLQAQLNEVSKKIEKLEEKYFILEVMDDEAYGKFSAKYKAEKAQILEQLADRPKVSSNQPNALRKAANLCANLLMIWQLGNIKLREQLQKLVFPLGIEYDRENGVVRTEKVNEVFQLIAKLSGASGGSQRGLPPFLWEQSPLAEREGFEPPDLLQSPVFKTGAIDHSATSPGAKLAEFLAPGKKRKARFASDQTFTSFHFPFLKYHHATTAITVSATGTATNAPVGPSSKYSASKYASGIWNSQKQTKLMTVGVRVSPAPFRACVITIAMP